MIELSIAKRIRNWKVDRLFHHLQYLESQELADLDLGVNLTMSGFFANERNFFWSIQFKSVSQSSILKVHIILASKSRISIVPRLWTLEHVPCQRAGCLTEGVSILLLSNAISCAVWERVKNISIVTRISRIAKPLFRDKKLGVFEIFFRIIDCEHIGGNPSLGNLYKWRLVQ